MGCASRGAGGFEDVAVSTGRGTGCIEVDVGWASRDAGGLEYVRVPGGGDTGCIEVDGGCVWRGAGGFEDVAISAGGDAGCIEGDGRFFRFDGGLSCGTGCGGTTFDAAAALSSWSGSARLITAFSV